MIINKAYFLIIISGGSYKMKRCEQKIEDTWNMQDMYENEELMAQDVEKLRELMKEFASRQNSLAKSGEQLLRALKLQEEMNCLYEKLHVYANQKYHEDTAEAKYQKLSGEMQILGTELSGCTAWLEPELLALPQQKLAEFFAETPELADYRWVVEQIVRQREHVLDVQTEELLAKLSELGQAPANIFSMFNNADIRFPDAVDSAGNAHPLTQGNYIPMLKDSDRVLRRSAFTALYGVYAQYCNTLAATYYANAKQADIFAKQHKFAGAMEQALSANAIPMAVYENLVKTIREHLPLMHRYTGLRKKMLGLDELHMYDNYVPIVEMPQKKYPFAEAKEIVKKALAPLGEDYTALLQEGFDNRWIDVYENEGKRTGAYSWGAYGTHPYVLLNYQGTLNAVFTLAHEMGHALHSWHSDHRQPYRYAGYRIFVAEVASTCNEALLIRHLLNRTEETQEKRYLINHFLESFRGTLFRQTMFAEFEAASHRKAQEGETLTASALGELYHKLNEDYFGPEMVVDPEIDYEWERIPHFYTPFYVYQYATGFSAAVAISSRILSGDEAALAGYKKFLQGGCSLPPIDLLKLCGVDMSTTKPVDEALKVFGELVEEFCRL